PVYNMQMGAAEIAGLLKDYRGSYVMTFAGYNAGRGRVQQWVAQHGDPRDPKVDAVDWVERIPIAETRNYVQRVMENLQVYRARSAAPAARPARPPCPARGASTRVPSRPRSSNRSPSDQVAPRGGFTDQARHPHPLIPPRIFFGRLPRPAITFRQVCRTTTH